jgi:hypothetical protein
MRESERPTVLTDDGADIDAGTIAEVPDDPETIKREIKQEERFK